MKKQALFMVVLLAAVGLLAGVAAGNALANSGGNENPCVSSSCHGNAGPAPTPVLVSNNGTTATYTVANAGPPASHEWAVFNGNTRITGTGQNGNTATGGSFTVPVGPPTRSTTCTNSRASIPLAARPRSARRAGRASPSRRRAGANGSISPATAQTVNTGGNVTLHDHSRRRLSRRRRPRRRCLGRCRHLLPVHQCDGEPHHRGLVRRRTRRCRSPSRPTAGANGAITPVGPQTVAAGSDLTFSITPSAGYYVETLKIDGTAVQPAKSYTFTNVQANHSIEATFAASPTMCTITASIVGGNGGGDHRRPLPLHAAPDRQRHLLLRSGCRLPHRLGPGQRLACRAGRRRFVHVLERRQEQHRLSEVRRQHSTPSRPASPVRARSPRPARRPSTRATTSPTRSRPMPATPSATSSWTASRSAS